MCGETLFPMQKKRELDGVWVGHAQMQLKCI